MTNVYPKATNVVEVVPADEAEVATRIIEQMDAGATKAQAIGPALAGSDDMATFNRLWKEIEDEGKRLRAVNPEDSKSDKQYKVALKAEAKWLDVDVWVAGYMAEQGIDDVKDTVKPKKEKEKDGANI